MQPIQLRPKSDDELAKWKEKIAKGKQDGTHTYITQNPFTLNHPPSFSPILTAANIPFTEFLIPYKVLGIARY